LPRGGFGFEFCCGRSFIVANVTVEAFAPTDSGNPLAEFLDQLKQKRQPLDEAQKARASLPSQRPGKIAWTTDVTDKPLQTHVLLRGNYKSPGDPVEPGGFGRLSDHLAADVTDSGEPDTVKSRSIPQESGALRPPVQEVAREKFVPPRGTGRRLAFARWITRPDSSPASLLARVHVNRLWQQHFGTGIVATPDNFGLSGSPPSHPELLDWLAAEFIRSGWSPKRVTRLIVNSAAYRQSSSTDDRRLQLDPDVRRLSRFPVRRLDAEAIRDALLAASGDLDDRLFGPYIPTSRTGSGETVVPEKQPGSVRRSVYLQQKRTQVHSLLQVFDAPSIVFNSTRRPRSTMPLQSLSLLNSEFVTSRARSLANRLNPDESSDSQRIRDLFRIATGRDPTDIQMAAAIKFLMTETAEYAQHSDARRRAWTDLCQMVLISNPALYLD